MNRKLQVFVSSTYEDMKAERQAAVEAILQAGHIPAGMELFASGSDSQVETIRRWIDDSDVFMLILGGRYGTVEPKSGKSYIQLEFEHAVSQSKPLFAAVIDQGFLNEKAKSAGLDVVERLNGVKLQEFTETVKSRICRFFSSLPELQVIVFQSLGIYAQNPALAGWVRGSDVAASNEALLKLADLNLEITRLRDERDEANALAQSLLAQSVSTDSGSAELSSEAQQLLAAAARSDGYIYHSQYIGGSSVQAGHQNFLKSQTAREEAIWKAAIDELEEGLLITCINPSDGIYRVTKAGYETQDSFESADERGS